jgi:hypothetical protein
MKRIVVIALFLAASFLTTRTAMAQSYVVEVNVPFSFNVNSTTLPAGHYSIATDLDQPAVLTFRDRAKGIVAMNLAMSDPSGSGKPGTLLFNHYGDQYFLSEIRFRSTSEGVVFPVSKFERRAKKQSQMEKRTVFAS